MEHPVRIFVLGVFLCVLCEDCLALKDVQIKVPSAVVQGDKAVLECVFDLEGDKLYSVKWYRGAGEFYRYTPSDLKPIKQFKIKGFHVVEDESNATQVVLDRVSRTMSGAFSCEVTADQPSFYTDMKTAELKVVVPPEGDPVIVGLKTRYRIGDILKANCTSQKSSPATNLAWYVNEKHMDKPHVHKFKYREGDFFVSKSTLRLQLTDHHFHDKGNLKVKCSANIHHIYHRSSEKSVELEKKRKHNWANVRYVVSTTTNPAYPQEKWQYVENTPPPKSTLFFSFPISGHAPSTKVFEATPLFLLGLLLLFYR